MYTDAAIADDTGRIPVPVNPQAAFSTAPEAS